MFLRCYFLFSVSSATIIHHDITKQTFMPWLQVSYIPWLWSTDLIIWAGFFGSLRWVFTNPHGEIRPMGPKCRVCTCKQDAYLNLNKMFSIETGGVCVCSTINKCNKNRNCPVRLNYCDPRLQFTSLLISKHQYWQEPLCSHLICLDTVTKMNQIRVQTVKMKIKSTFPLIFCE